MNTSLPSAKRYYRIPQVPSWHAWSYVWCFMYIYKNVLCNTCVSSFSRQTSNCNRQTDRQTDVPTDNGEVIPICPWISSGGTINQLHHKQEVRLSLLCLVDLRKIHLEGHGHIVLRVFQAFYDNNRNYKNRYDLDTECICQSTLGWNECYNKWLLHTLLNKTPQWTKGVDCCLFYNTQYKVADVTCFLAMSKCYHTALITF